MSVKNFVLVMLICAVVCSLGWLSVLFLVNPQTSGTFGIVLFYASLFFGIVSIFTLISFLIRRLFVRYLLPPANVAISFRQGLFLGLVLVGALYLQVEQLLTWFNALLLVALLSCVEFFILSFNNHQET